MIANVFVYDSDAIGTKLAKREEGFGISAEIHE